MAVICENKVAGEELAQMIVDRLNDKEQSTTETEEVVLLCSKEGTIRGKEQMRQIWDSCIAEHERWKMHVCTFQTMFPDSNPDPTTDSTADPTAYYDSLLRGRVGLKEPELPWTKPSVCMFAVDGPVLLWDVDKTMVDTHGMPDLFARVAEDMGADLACATLPPKDGKTDSQIALDYLSATGLGRDRCQEFMEKLERESESFFREGAVRPIEGVVEVLRLARDCGMVSSVYTGNTPRRMRLKLASAGIVDDPPLFSPKVFCMGDKPRRSDGVAEVLQEFSNRRLVVIGDSQLDCDLAESLGAAFWHVGMTDIAYENVRVLGHRPDFSPTVREEFMKGLIAYVSPND